MAEFKKEKHAQDEFNDGNKYVANDGVQPATINNLVENSLFTVAFAESLASTPDTTKVAQVGTPSVELINNPSAGVTGAKKFKFSNLKGEQGHGYFRANVSLDTTATSVPSSSINWGPLTEALASDSIVDNNGNVFAVTTRTAATSPTIPISYRTSIRGKAGADGTDGDDGDSVFIRYSSSSNGANMTAAPTADTHYIGFYRGQSASNTASDYAWSQYVGKEISEVAIDEFSFVITYNDGTTSTAPLNTDNCLLTYAVPSDKATAMTALLVPNNADLNDYRGASYWGKTFYAGGNNTVQNLPYSNGAGFSLEVLKSGRYSTIQRLSALTSEGNKVPTVYIRSVVDTAAEASGTYSEWQEVAEANGTYPEMGVGEAGQLSTHIVGNYSAGRHYGKWAHIEAEDNARVSAVFLVNGSNNPSEEGSGLLEVEFINRTTGVEEVAVNVLSGDLMPNLFLAVPTADGVDVYVYIREYRTSYISLVSLTPHSTITWMNESTGSTEPAGAVYATRTNNASGAEYLSRFAYLFAGTSQTGWWKLGSIKGDGMGVNQNRSCVFLVNCVLSNQGLATTGETGFLEFDVRKESAITDAKLSVLGGNLNAEEFCVVLSQTEATVYIKLPSQFNAFAVTMLSEDSASASKATPLFEFDTQFIGTSAPSGAQYAVVRNIAYSAKYLTAGSLSLVDAEISAGTNTATFNLSSIIDSGLFLAVGEHNLPDGGGYSLFFDASKTTGASCPFVFGSNILENKIMYNASDKTIRIQTGATSNILTAVSLTLYAISKI